MENILSRLILCPMSGFQPLCGYLLGCDHKSVITSLKTSRYENQILHENIVQLFYFVKESYYSNIEYVLIEYNVNNYYIINLLLMMLINELLEQRNVEVEAKFTLVPNVKINSDTWRVNFAIFSAETMRYRVYRVIGGSSPLTGCTIESEPILARHNLRSTLAVCFFLLPLNISGRETVLQDMTNADIPSNKKKSPPNANRIRAEDSLLMELTTKFLHCCFRLATAK